MQNRTSQVVHTKILYMSPADRHSGLTMSYKVTNLWVILVISPGQQHQAWAHKAGQVVHMPVSNGIISCHTLPQPDDLLKSKVLLQLSLNTLLAQARVAARVQQTLLSADQSPAPPRSDGVSRSSLRSSFSHAVRHEAPLSPIQARMNTHHLKIGLTQIVKIKYRGGRC